MRDTRGLLYDDLSRSVIGAFFDVYNELGFNVLESIYCVALCEELRRRGHHAQREVWIDVFYKGSPIARQRIDLIVDDRLVVEVKAGELLPRFARRQLLNYL